MTATATLPAAIVDLGGRRRLRVWRRGRGRCAAGDRRCRGRRSVLVVVARVIRRVIASHRGDAAARCDGGVVTPAATFAIISSRRGGRRRRRRLRGRDASGRGGSTRHGNGRRAARHRSARLGAALIVSAAPAVGRGRSAHHHDRRQGKPHGGEHSEAGPGAILRAVGRGHCGHCGHRVLQSSGGRECPGAELQRAGFLVEGAIRPSSYGVLAFGPQVDQAGEAGRQRPRPRHRLPHRPEAQRVAAGRAHRP